MPHEVKVRDKEMTARRRSKMAVLTPSMLKAAAVPVGGVQRERKRVEALRYILLEVSSPGSRQ